ncbi:hypothetical protein HOY80DRAFT_978539 [Tuber brumale]|nr:hypothetical protein HOY80DRAFT_978539 [Tuber brumale]
MSVYIPGGRRSFLYRICWGTGTLGGFSRNVTSCLIPRISRRPKFRTTGAASHSSSRNVTRLAGSHEMARGVAGFKADCPTNHES